VCELAFRPANLVGTGRAAVALITAVSTSVITPVGRPTVSRPTALMSVLSRRSKTARVPLQAAIAASMLAAIASARPAWSLPNEQPPLALADRANTPTTGGDTAAVHRQLRKSIEQFQDRWRKAWQKAEMKRHKYVNLPQIRGWDVRADGKIIEPFWQGDRDALNLTPDLRRYLAILCNVDSPTDRQIEAIKSKASANIGSPSGFKAQPIDVNSRPGELRRYSAGTYEREMSFVTPRLIAPKPNKGAVCPSWTPPDEPIPLDEGESIDLAFPVREREPLRRDREQLIRLLTDAQARYPNDLWIMQQRLRFVVDQRSDIRALEIAEECKVSSYDCARLVGFAEGQAKSYAKADAAYRYADSIAYARPLSDANPCISNAVWLLFTVADREKVNSKPCSEQRAFIDRMWWLSDPMWSVPGNERYVEHNSRQMHIGMRSVLDRDERYVWSEIGGGNAMFELVTRYGWPGYTFWPGGQLEEEINKVREDPARTRFVAPPYTAKEYSPDRSALLPQLEAILNPLSLTPAHYTVTIPDGKNQDEWWPQEHMMLFPRLKTLPAGQSSQWRRDSTIAFSMAVENVLHGLDTAATGPSTAALVGSTGPTDLRILQQVSLTVGQTLRLNADYASTPFVMSAEVRARSVKENSLRLRYGLRPPPALREMSDNEVAMSDLTFLRLPARSTALPTSPETMLPLMAGRLTFGRNEPLALYWESYGFLPNDSVNFALRINRREDTGVARRIGSALGVASALDDSVSISWSEPDARQSGSVIPAMRSTIGRSVALDLTQLPPGNYAVSIEMRRGSNIRARSERLFTIRN
jgi:hypothetical protein